MLNSAGPTPEVTAVYNRVGTLMRQNAKEYVRSLSVFLLEQNYSPELVEQFIRGTDKGECDVSLSKSGDQQKQTELEELSVHMYATWHYAWAEKVPGDEMDNHSTLLFRSPTSPLGRVSRS